MSAQARHDRVIAVVLTYNRKTLLAQCLEALSRQTRPCDAIFVIDNASTDSTAAFVKEQWADKVSLFRLSGEYRSRGGFNAGLRIAYQHEADFIWMMDDDVIPDEDCLEGLLAGDRALEDRGVERAFLVPTAWTPEGTRTNVPEIDRRHNDLAYENWTSLLDVNLVPVTRATFVGILLPRETVARYGLPIADMFMWGDDTEYTVRISKTMPGFIVGPKQGLPHSCAERVPEHPDRERSGSGSLPQAAHPEPVLHGIPASRKTRRPRLHQAAPEDDREAHRLGHGRKALLILTGLVDGFRFNPASSAPTGPRTG